MAEEKDFHVMTEPPGKAPSPIAQQYLEQKTAVKVKYLEGNALEIDVPGSKWQAVRAEFTTGVGSKRYYAGVLSLGPRFFYVSASGNELMFVILQREKPAEVNKIEEVGSWTAQEG